MTFIKRFLLLMVVVVINTALLFSNTLSILKNKNFTLKLELSKSQEQSLTKILSIEKTQLTLDEENFKNDFFGLKNAEKIRMNMIEDMFLDILSYDQKKKYKIFKKELVLGYDVFTFQKTMNFNKEQQEKVREIIIIYNNSELSAREKNRNDSTKLIMEAIDRIMLLDSSLKKILNENQLKKYDEIVLKRDSDVEFFRYKEGLILNDDQAYEVKNILLEYERANENSIGFSNSWDRKRNKRYDEKNTMIESVLKPFQLNLFHQLTKNIHKKDGANVNRNTEIDKRGDRKRF